MLIKNKDYIIVQESNGNLNILNRKINFKDISINENYKASNEDLKYFKESFENKVTISATTSLKAL
mgnify:CR=1 FL=1